MRTWSPAAISERNIETYRRKLSWHLVMQMGENIMKYNHEVDVLVNVSAGVASISGRYNQATAVRVFSDDQPSLFEQSIL